MSDLPPDLALASQEVLLDEVILGNGRGHVPRRELSVEVIRPLVPEDLPLLVNPPPLNAAPAASNVEIRHSHHQLAQLIASGASGEHISAVTGYSPSWISQMKKSPAFVELLTYYEAQKDLAFVDLLGRMRSLAISTIEELQARVAQEPKSWSHRELMELAKLLAVDGPKGAAEAARGGPSSGPGVSVTVNFVRANHEGPSAGPIIENGSSS